MCSHSRPTHRERHRLPGLPGLPGAARIALAGSALLLAGCAQILGIDDLSSGRDAAPPDASPPGVFIDAAPPDAGVDTSCSEGTTTEGTGTTGLDTEAAGNEFSATCGGESSPDLMLVWTAPVTDYYVIDTFGSSFDTVLAVFDECGGQELACSNNVDDSPQSEVVQKLRQGQPALVLVDGAAGDSGQATLNIQRVTCPDADLEGQTFPVELSTLGFGDDFTSPCGGGGVAEDRAYHWVAPADGLYYFRATSETFTPVVTLLDGPRCTDRVLACNPASSGQFGAEAVRFLRAGQQVSVIVDGRTKDANDMGGAGVFTLDIGIKQGDECPETTLAGDSFSDQLTAPTLSSSCGFTRQGGNFGELYEVPDKVYTMHLDGFGPSCRNFCDVIVRSQRALVLYTLEGNDCGGAELSCVVADVPPAGGQAEASVRLEAIGEEDRDYTIVVADRFKDGDETYQIEVVCGAVC